MALIKRKGGKNWYWQFKYTDVDGKQKTKRVSTGIPATQTSAKAQSKARKAGIALQEEFQKTLSQQKTHKLSKRSKENEHSEDTFAEYADYWLEEVRGSVEDNTWISYRTPLKNRICPLIGDIRLVDLDQYDLKEFINAELEDCNQRQQRIDERIKAANGKKVKIQTGERPYFQSIKK